MRIFVSYSSRDKIFVRRLVEDLDRSDMDVSPWLDERELRVGQAISSDTTGLESVIAQCACVLVIVSRSSSGSFWVDREIGIAESAGVRVLPVLLEDVPAAWAPRFAGLAHVDFRRAEEYRRSLHRLMCAIEDVPVKGRFLRAKEAVARVKARCSPAGELFGISQQGVAALYSLANIEDWEFADAMDGSSRFWICEFYAESSSRIQAYAVVDGRVEELPEMYLYGSDLVPVPGSVIVLSCALNHTDSISGEHADALVERSANETTEITKRYSRFRPILLDGLFVDSTEAIRAATSFAFGSSGPLDRGGDLFVLSSLECDKRHGNLPTWKVAFFNPALTSSVLTIGVDPRTGRVRDRTLPEEFLNARFMAMRIDADGHIVLDVNALLSAADAKIWDIPESGLTATEALKMAAALLTERHGSIRWQLAFLSNTGVIRSEASPAFPSPRGALLTPDGIAGQWVVEVCGAEYTVVRDAARVGYRHAYRRIVCTRQLGPVEADADPVIILTSPLSASPLPGDLLDAYERARTIAIGAVRGSFSDMSVALRRPGSGAEWFFRFYEAGEIAAKVSVSAAGDRVLWCGTPPT